MAARSYIAKLSSFSVASVLLAASAEYSSASGITIINGDFSLPALGSASYGGPIADWTETAGAGLINDANYGPSDPGPNGTTQSAYINNGNVISQTVGTVSASSYTLQFYLSGDAGPNLDHTVVAFVDGANSDVLASSAPLLGTGEMYTQYDIPLTITPSAQDQVGDPLVLEFYPSSQAGDNDFQSFLADVTVATPEPASLGIFASAATALLTRRKRR